MSVPVYTTGSKVQARDYVVRRHERLRDLVGEVTGRCAAPTKGSESSWYVVEFPGIDGEFKFGPSHIKPAGNDGSGKTAKAADAPKRYAAAVAAAAARRAERTETEPDAPLPGEPGDYEVTFASADTLKPHPDDADIEYTLPGGRAVRGWTGVLRVHGEGQIDAALRAGKIRDDMIQYRKKKDGPKPHDRVMKTILLRVDVAEEVTA